MITVMLQIELEGECEDLADTLDCLVCECLNNLDIYPISVLIDSVEEN